MCGLIGPWHPSKCQLFSLSLFSFELEERTRANEDKSYPDHDLFYCFFLFPLYHSGGLFAVFFPQSVQNPISTNSGLALNKTYRVNP